MPEEEGLTYERYRTLKIVLRQWINSRILGVYIGVQRFTSVRSQHTLSLLLLAM
jgi:hypothetical protein